MDYHWFVIVLTGLYTHLRDSCVVGLCFQKESSPPFDSSVGSVIFVISVLCLVAEYNLWPRTLKEPPLHLLIIYEMLVAALITNLALQMIWMPLMHMTFAMTQESSRCLLWVNAEAGLDKYSPLVQTAHFMATDAAASYAAVLMSLLSFVWMLDATESLDTLLYDTFK